MPLLFVPSSCCVYPPTLLMFLLRKVAEVRSTAPKDAVRRVLDYKKWGKEKLCEELEQLRAIRKK